MSVWFPHALFGGTVMELTFSLDIKNKSPLYVSRETKEDDYKKYLDKITSSREKKIIYEFDAKKQHKNKEINSESIS